MSHEISESPLIGVHRRTSAVKILPHHLDTIRTHAESTYPEECCGIMLGYLSDDTKTVVELIPTENAWSPEAADSFPETHLANSKTKRYTISPQALLQAQRDARVKSLHIVGIYHSHPDYPATPSEFDRLCAWQQYSYIIVSVPNGKAGQINSWCLDDTHQFQPEEIISMG